jgi:hypothetical protein
LQQVAELKLCDNCYEAGPAGGRPKLVLQVASVANHRQRI